VGVCRAMFRTWKYFFRSGESDPDMDTQLIFTAPELLDSLQNSSTNYFQINNVSTISFMYEQR
jgi:hypothetical protein